MRCALLRRVWLSVLLIFLLTIVISESCIGGSSYKSALLSFKITKRIIRKTGYVARAIDNFLFVSGNKDDAIPALSIQEFETLDKKFDLTGLRDELVGAFDSDLTKTAFIKPSYDICSINKKGKEFCSSVQADDAKDTKETILGCGNMLLNVKNTDFGITSMLQCCKIYEQCLTQSCATTKNACDKSLQKCLLHPCAAKDLSTKENKSCVITSKMLLSSSLHNSDQMFKEARKRLSCQGWEHVIYNYKTLNK